MYRVNKERLELMRYFCEVGDNMERRYEYGSEFEYELHTYEEKVKFAKYQVESQLNSAILRKKGEDFELRIYGGIFLIMLILFPLSVLFTMSGGVLAVLGAVMIIILIACFIFVMPVCLYKTIKGMILWIVNRQKFLGSFILKYYDIPTSGNEIYNCRTWQNKYQLMLDDIERWKEEMKCGEMSFTKEQIRDKFHEINLNPRIRVATEQNGEVLGLTKRVTIYLLLIIYFFLISFLRNFFGEMYDQMVELFRAI